MAPFIFLDDLPTRQLAECILTIGNFDGVHRGHGTIIARARALAGSGGRVAALTFDPHPLAVLRPGQGPAPLTTLTQRAHLLRAAGVDDVVVARATPELLQLEADVFVERIIAERFAPRHVVEGQSFGFGRGRAGNPDMLRALGPEHGFEVLIVDPVRIVLADHRDVVLSSSVVRTLVAAGDTDAAEQCLARPYAIDGVVRRGHARGRALGFPTINLEDITQLIPAAGVYAGMVRIGPECHAAAISIGKTPTFDDERMQVEAHLLDFDQDVYDQTVRLSFYDRLRAQQRFASPDELVQQIERDIARVRGIARERAE